MWGAARWRRARERGLDDGQRARQRVGLRPWQVGVVVTALVIAALVPLGKRGSRAD